MCSKKNVITKVYEALLKDKKTFEMLKMELSQNGQLDETFICEHILPLAKKVDPSITWQDILAFEKEALTQPKKISLTDLENISGGKASNVLLSCGLLALMGFSGLAASNVASADFIEFTKTKEYSDYNAYLSKGDDASTEEREKYEFVTLGEVPFYLQADHLVDGLLWFRSPDEDKAFFVMDRKFEDKKAVYTYSADSPSQLNTAEKTIKKPSLKDIQSQEFKLFNINELTGYLQNSFNDADKTKFNPITHKDSQTLQLADDNPLFNFSRFYNEDFQFDKTSNRESLSAVKMFSSLSTKAYENARFDQKIENISYAQKLFDRLSNQPWTISHRSGFRKQPAFYSIESSKTLSSQLGKHSDNTFDFDEEVIRNNSFTFFTLQVGKGSARNPLALRYESVHAFKNIPLASCSIDLFDSSCKKTSDPCFNGSSEEIKDQLTTYYINDLFNSLSDKSEFNERNLNQHEQKIIDKIHKDALEVRIPTHVAVDKWEKVKLE